MVIAFDTTKKKKTNKKLHNTSLGAPESQDVKISLGSNLYFCNICGISF